LALRLFDGWDAGLLYVLAMGWVSVFLLALAQEDRLKSRPVWHALAAVLLNMLPLTLIAANLALTTSALGLEREGTLMLEPWIALQSSWNGWRWMGVLQPLLMVAWMIYAVPPRTGPQMQTSFARQIQCLDMALLTSTLFLGGWQGPLVHEYPGLGLLYTAIKVGIVSFIWVWAWVSLPQSSLVVRARDTWTVSVPVIVLNLLVTTMVVARW
jgi:NADH-quinone oxidoreductase subunit H